MQESQINKSNTDEKSYSIMAAVWEIMLETKERISVIAKTIELDFFLMLIQIFMVLLFYSYSNRNPRHWNLQGQFCIFLIFLCDKDDIQPSFLEACFISPLVRLEILNDKGLEFCINWLAWS